MQVAAADLDLEFCCGYKQGRIVLWMPLVCKWRRECFQNQRINPAENWSRIDSLCNAKSLCVLSPQSCLTESSDNGSYLDQQKMGLQRCF